MLITPSLQNLDISQIRKVRNLAGWLRFFLQPCKKVTVGFLKMLRGFGKSRVLVQLRRETHQNDRPGPYFSKTTKSRRYFVNPAISGRKCESSIMGRISAGDGFGALKNFLEPLEGLIYRFPNGFCEIFIILGYFGIFADQDLGFSRIWILDVSKSLKEIW